MRNPSIGIFYAFWSGETRQNGGLAVKGKENNMNKGVKAVMFGTIGGLVVCTALLLIASFALAQMKSVPGSAIGTITMVFGALGALAGGYIAVRIARCRGMMYGILTGLALFLVVVIVGVCSSNESVTIATVIKGIAMLLSGAIGGIVAVNKKQRVR